MQGLGPRNLGIVLRVAGLRSGIVRVPSGSFGFGVCTCGLHGWVPQARDGELRT